MSLKEKTISGFFWSAVDNFSNQGIQFIVGVILARLLGPREFGLIGMITIFIALSRTFINSGFSSALIQKKNCTQTDYSTVFYYNLAIGLVLFLLLYFSAGLISDFFGEPELKWLIRVLGIELILGSATLIQGTTIVKRIDFKLQAKIVVISGVLSGIIGIVMAYTGFGVWSLVARSLSGTLFRSLFLWFWNRWCPSWVFSVKSFKELFGFGSKILASRLIDTAYNNIYYLIIGKYFSAQELGFYSRAQSFASLPSKNLNSIMSRVTYPVLSQMQDNDEFLREGYKRMIKNIMFISLILMAILAAVAEPMVISFIGEKWRTSIIYLQLLCFPGMLYPLHALNLNMLNVKGRSDLFLKLEIIKKIMVVPFVVIGVLYGIKIMILGMWINSLIAYYLNSYYSGRLINYSFKEQVTDIFPSFLLALTVGFFVYIIGSLVPATYPVKLTFQLVTSVILVLGFSEILKFKPYLEMKNIVKTKLITAFNEKR